MAEIFDHWAEKYDQWNDDLENVSKIEKLGSKKGLNTGAFLAARWLKPK